MKKITVSVILFLTVSIGYSDSESDFRRDLMRLGVLTYVGPVVAEKLPILVGKTDLIFCDVDSVEEKILSIEKIALSKHIDSRLAEKFVNENQNSEELDEGCFEGDLEVNVMPSDEYEKMFSGGGDLGDVWGEVKVKFPDSFGLMRVSKVVLNDNRKEALMSIWVNFPGPGGHGAFVKFKKVGSVWWCYEVPDAPSGME